MKEACYAATPAIQLAKDYLVATITILICFLSSSVTIALAAFAPIETMSWLIGLTDISVWPIPNKYLL
jgi:hypothetical protein